MASHHGRSRPHPEARVRRGNSHVALVSTDQRIPARPSRRELDDEVQFHVEERIRELMATGLSREAAAEQTARRFGNRLRTREAEPRRQADALARVPRAGHPSRSARAPSQRARHDCRGSVARPCAWRIRRGVLAHRCADSPAAAGSRARAARVPDVLQREPLGGSLSTSESSTFADPMFVQLREAGRGRVALFAMSTQVLRSMSFDGADAEKEQVRTQFVSGDAFTTLGVSPAAGRLLTHRGRPDTRRAPGRDSESRVLAATVRRRPIRRRTLAESPGGAISNPSIPDRRRR